MRLKCTRCQKQNLPSQGEQYRMTEAKPTLLTYSVWGVSGKSCPTKVLRMTIKNKNYTTEAN